MVKTDIKNRERIKNIIFAIVILVLIMIIVVMSSMVKSRDSNYVFNSSDFENIMVIGLSEYEASYNVDSPSIVYFGSNEDENSREQLKILNDLAGEYDLLIEYIDVLELVDSEKERLKELNVDMIDSYYPDLVIIKDGQTVNNSNKYLKREEMIDIFKKYEIISQ